MPKAGVLFIVATPIGNVGDISARACETLSSVSIVLAEDTRHSSGLLKRLGIKADLHSYHQHNEEARTDWALERLKMGEDLALISDAGTPLLSDPGYRLVQGAHDNGIRVEPIPGASSIMAALSVAGLPSDRFFFEGFLPSKSGSRKARLGELRSFPHTLIFLESPHRVLACIEDMLAIFGENRVAVVARELTKLHETVYKQNLAELHKWMLSDPNQVRGEFVILVSGAEPEEATQKDVDGLLEILLADLSAKKAATVAAQITGKKKNQLYQRILELNK
ncbi:MAG TPA: 16S rRNA (cytidine(1402)-2'-O)-methyltransferase [Gammaproteobacteria bacterium]|jgi:16S rRNA (cytidine1402-2'-O)-methyltransferase|nr:16S rRNA (cytidine(1402)-2'-O)-methyltransferase [Pseudomonadota bacterium]HAY47236.1 16S rRNA (cytidine(1402)-2'-O)-methyltransferase [Gammaproteobacteria bacterium]